MKKQLIELGNITDLNGKQFTAYCEHLRINKHFDEVECEGIVLELQDREGNVLETLNVPSLAEMPDRFSQKQVNALEEWILSQQAAFHQEYLNDLKNNR